MKQNVFSLVNVTKVAAKAAMVSLTACVLTLTSCSNETANYHPTAATGLMADSASQRGLGWHLFTVKASATDIDGNSISANAEVRYDADRVVYVENEEELGLPISATTPDGQTFYTNDKNTIRRTENHSADGVNLNVAGGEFRYGALGARLNDTTQVCYAYIADQAFATANLPESFSKEWRGEKVSVVEYHRVWRKPTTPVYEPMYRMRAERVEIDEGNVYYDIFVEKSTDNGTTWAEMDKWEYFLACQFGEWKPNVTSTLLVNSYEFTTDDKPVDMEKSTPRLNEGVTKRWDIINDYAQEFRWAAMFNAPADAEGSIVRTIGGAQILKIWKMIYHNPETGKDLEINFTGSIRTTTHEVDKTTGIYSRTVEVICNNEVVDTQVGTVQLQLAN